MVYAHQARAAEALRLGAVAKALCETVGMVLPPAVDIWIGNAMSLARQALPPEAAEAAWAQGRALSLEQAISEAMQ